MKTKPTNQWQKTTLKEVCTKITDGTHKTPNYIKDGIPFISTNNLDPTISGFDFTQYEKYISKEEHSELTKRCKPEKGDILISKCGTIGRTKNIDVDYEFSIFVGLALLKLDKSRVNSKYLELLLNSDEYNRIMNGLAPGSTRKTLTLNTIEKIPIVLPPMFSQQKIVEILEKVQRLKKLRDEADKLTRDLLKAVFLDMFGKKNKFSIIELKDLVEEFRFGSSLKSGPEGYPIIGIPNVLGETLKLDNCNKIPLSHKEFENYNVKFGDILFVRTNGNPNYVGRCNVFPIKNSNYVFASYLIRARLKSDLIDPYFLKTYLELPSGRKELLSKCRTTAGQYNINTQGLGSMKIPLPPLDLQRKFAGIVSQIAGIKERQKQSKEQIENIFNDLMQKAFRGELAC